MNDLFIKFPDIEIIFENKILTLFGYKYMVSNAKAELAQIINNNTAFHLSSMMQQMKVATEIQWQYLSYSNEWKSFSVFLNSLIESNFLKKESSVIFIFK